MRTRNGPTIAGVLAVLAYLLIGLGACTGAAPLRPSEGAYPLTRLVPEGSLIAANDGSPLSALPAPGDRRRP